MDVLDITKQYLKENGYDGLYCENECGCGIEDLAPCDGPIHSCRPGYKVSCKCGEGCNFHIAPLTEEQCRKLYTDLQLLMGEV